MLATGNISPGKKQTTDIGIQEHFAKQIGIFPGSLANLSMAIFWFQFFISIIIREVMGIIQITAHEIYNVSFKFAFLDFYFLLSHGPC